MMETYVSKKYLEEQWKMAMYDLRKAREAGDEERVFAAHRDGRNIIEIAARAFGCAYADDLQKMGH